MNAMLPTLMTFVIMLSILLIYHKWTSDTVRCPGCGYRFKSTDDKFYLCRCPRCAHVFNHSR